MSCSFRWPVKSGIAVIALAGFVAGCGDDTDAVEILTPLPTGFFAQTNLVADASGFAGAVTIDPLLINSWGIAFGANNALWVANAETGTLTTYTGAGAKLSLTVTVPGSPGNESGAPTGLVFNTTADFAVAGVPSQFIAASEDGTISAWNTASGTTAVVVVDNPNGESVYKGLTIAASNGANYLYAANFHAGRVDMFDHSFTLVKSFTDPSVPAGYAPFNVAAIGNQLMVTFAKQLGPDNEDDESGPGNGFVDVFNTDGTFARRLSSGGVLNSPWAVVAVPNGFGSLGGTVLVGNFGDGKINVFNASTGAFIDALRDINGNPIVIEGLWGLAFAPNAAVPTLYFSSGPGDETHGLVGTLTSH